MMQALPIYLVIVQVSRTQKAPSTAFSQIQVQNQLVSTKTVAPTIIQELFLPKLMTQDSITYTTYIMRVYKLRRKPNMDLRLWF